ncbi:crinkler family protein [Plasmopara halstedii]|uniref:Crinkler family protein n=1 Tax=Plasmopara halstedii TaxID=4781 RepID=A0A0P1AX01_PLAHL|nr:crinkler family protein [Plasmopara halstedii]CEG45695.1 crinkler family protein [Plasmopara halstedii]|eukprot:XP_024582064.1 crinkler family protein [Plasmopara halstedii]
MGFHVRFGVAEEDLFDGIILFESKLSITEAALGQVERYTQNSGLTASPVGKIIETPEGAAFLLSPVGKPLPRPTTRPEVLSLFKLSRQLHKNGLVHGDPRVPNVILDGEKLLWIDLVKVMEASPTLKQIDAGILTRSILSVSLTTMLDPVLMKSID